MDPSEINNPWLHPIGGHEAATILTTTLSGAVGITCAFVFGSLASGGERADSDVDLFVIGSIAGRDLSRLTSRLSDTALGRELNYVLYSEVDFQNRVRDRNHFVRDVLSKPKLFVFGKEDALDHLTQRLRCFHEP